MPLKMALVSLPYASDDTAAMLQHLSSPPSISFQELVKHQCPQSAHASGDSPEVREQAKAAQLQLLLHAEDACSMAQQYADALGDATANVSALKSLQSNSAHLRSLVEGPITEANEVC